MIMICAYMSGGEGGTQRHVVTMECLKDEGDVLFHFLNTFLLPCPYGQVASDAWPFLPGLATGLSSVCGLSGHRHAHGPAPALKTRAKAHKTRQKEPEHSHLLIRKTRIVTRSLCHHSQTSPSVSAPQSSMAAVTVATSQPGRHQRSQGGSRDFHHCTAVGCSFHNANTFDSIFKASLIF